MTTTRIRNQAVPAVIRFNITERHKNTDRSLLQKATRDQHAHLFIHCFFVAVEREREQKKKKENSNVSHQLNLCFSALNSTCSPSFFFFLFAVFSAVMASRSARCFASGTVNSGTSSTAAVSRNTFHTK